MASVRKKTIIETPQPAAPHDQTLKRINAPFAEGKREEAIAERVALAREVDPRNPIRAGMVIGNVIAWLESVGEDPASYGLSIEPEPEKKGPEKLVGGNGEVMSPAPNEPHVPTRLKNHGAEQGILAACVADNPIIDKVFPPLNPEDFGYHNNRFIARAIVDLNVAGKPVDEATILHTLSRKGSIDLGGLRESLRAICGIVMTPAKLDSYVEIVATLAEDRRKEERVQKLRKAAVDKTSVEFMDIAREVYESNDSDSGSGLTDWVRRFPERPPAVFYYGLLGELTWAADPYSEADTASLMGQLLVGFGNMIGRNAHWKVGSDRHFTNLNIVIAGFTGNGRKGSSWNIVRDILLRVSEEWKDCIHTGMSSGEGFLGVIRDRSDPGKEPHDGVADKRALWVEREFDTALQHMGRKNNGLSGYVRDAWDSVDLRIVTKHDPTRVTNPHISTIAHITFEDIRKHLTANGMLNGLANRFLFLCTRKSKLLPLGKDFDTLDVQPQIDQLRASMAFASGKGFFSRPVEFDNAAKELWVSLYPHLCRQRPNKIAAITERCAPMVRRIAVIYAMTDRSRTVSVQHLQAAVAFWDYCERSVSYIFGDGEKDENEEKFLAEIRKSKDGLTHRELNRAVFGGRKPEETSKLLSRLLSRGQVEEKLTVTPGHRVVRYVVPEMSNSATLRHGALFESQVVTL